MRSTIPFRLQHLVLRAEDFHNEVLDILQEIVLVTLAFVDFCQMRLGRESDIAHLVTGHGLTETTCPFRW